MCSSNGSREENSVWVKDLCSHDGMHYSFAGPGPTGYCLATRIDVVSNRSSALAVVRQDGWHGLEDIDDAGTLQVSFNAEQDAKGRKRRSPFGGTGSSEMRMRPGTPLFGRMYIGTMLAMACIQYPLSRVRVLSTRQVYIGTRMGDSAQCRLAGASRGGEEPDHTVDPHGTAVIVTVSTVIGFPRSGPGVPVPSSGQGPRAQL